MRNIVGKAEGNRNRKWKGKAGLLFSQLLFVIICCSNPLTSLFHVFCIVLSPIYPNIKTDASSRTNDLPMYSTWFLFGLDDLVFFKLHKLLLKDCLTSIVCMFICFLASQYIPFQAGRMDDGPPHQTGNPSKLRRGSRKDRKSGSDHQDAHHPHACITLITKTIIITNILHHHRPLTSLTTLLKRQKGWPLATKRKKRGAWNIFNVFNCCW